VLDAADATFGSSARIELSTDRAPTVPANPDVTVGQAGVVNIEKGKPATTPVVLKDVDI